MTRPGERPRTTERRYCNAEHSDRPELVCELYLTHVTLRQPHLAIDTGAQKRELCTRLGAEAWIDFRESKDLVKDIKAATGGQGPHTAVITAATSTAYEQAVDYVRNGGTIMAVGLPARGDGLLAPPESNACDCDTSDRGANWRR